MSDTMERPTAETKTYDKIDPDFKVKWLAALRSGEYAQCRMKLLTEEGYCCLGVAARVAGYEMNLVSGYAALMDFGLTPTSIRPLVRKNDTEMLSFAQIADWVEGNL